LRLPRAALTLRQRASLAQASRDVGQSIIVGSVRDRVILRQFDSWLAGLEKACKERNASARSSARKSTAATSKLGLLFQVTAQTQEPATALMKSVGHMAVHYPVPEWSGLITSIAYPYSPAEMERGATYRFNMNHVVR
jgi:hypothetical protein